MFSTVSRYGNISVIGLLFDYKSCSSLVFPLHLGGVEAGAGWRHRQLANRTSVNVWLIDEQQIRYKSLGGQAPDEMKTSLGQKTKSENLQIGINNFEKHSCIFYFRVCRTKQALFVGFVYLRIKWHKTQCKYDQKIWFVWHGLFWWKLNACIHELQKKKNRTRFLCKQLEQRRVWTNCLTQTVMQHLYIYTW